MRYSLIPTLVLPVLSQAFSLDSSTKYWNYTTDSLASTTSKACKEAYGAEIACDEYLVQLVNAKEERFFLENMEPANFTITCSTSCKSSLVDYIANVKKSCTESGDAAVEALGFLGKKGRKDVPVETIGSIFEYMLMRSCAKDEDGEFCYPSQSSVMPTDFDCDWKCALAYYWNQHKYPYSLWSVGDQDVLDFDKDMNRIKVANDMLFNSLEDESVDLGWKNIQKCGLANSTAPFDVGLRNETTYNQTEHDSCQSKSGSCTSSSTAVAATDPATMTSAPTSTTTGSGGNKVFVTIGWLGLVALSASVLL
ncbi:hypothetical protein FE257_003289 [Aspergillus nanangensis]|uniref:Uncharacterized protein n=1 Tax=Aspergillus nanangensis TaxID=2582783 RepID=A0AAD4GXP8_ASPNN|nr:hypothetical protein FE257_003289 [Aspergillus nanangensis]